LEDEDNFDPDVDIRDYDAVAQSLPVFCVSSRAFQSLSGRLKKDNISHSGFLRLEDTEVPQLQAHARKLTEGSRLANSRRFLNDLMQLVNSMKMWAANDGSQSALCDKDKRKEEARLRRQLQQVETGFMAAIKECSTAINEAMSENIYDYFERTIPTAVEAAVPTATSWGAPRADGAGGLLWSTYKATCRRSGVFNGASGPRDFNEELFDPISKQLASGWEKTFQRRLPSCINNFVRTAKLLIETFHSEAIQTTQERGSNANGIHMLNNQLRALLQRVTDLPNVVNQLAQEMQRDSSRSFTPEIMNLMQPGYDKCKLPRPPPDVRSLTFDPGVEERGPGSYARMKVHMITHVDLIRQTMFRGATNVVRNQLEDLCRKIADQLLLQMQELHARLSHDYLAALFGADIANGDGIPRAERMLRSEMIPLLEAVDSQFEHLVPKPEDDAVDGLPQFDGVGFNTPQYDEVDYNNGDMYVGDAAVGSFTPTDSPLFEADSDGSRAVFAISSVTPAAGSPPEFNDNKGSGHSTPGLQHQSDSLPLIKDEPF
jgi:hypothetical protein